MTNLERDLLQVLSDKLAISEQISKFSHYRDDEELENLVNLFDENSKMEWINGKNEQEFIWEGKNEIKEGFMAFLEMMKNWEFPDEELKGVLTRHIQANTIFIDLKSDRANTKTAFIVTFVRNNNKTGIENLPTAIYQGHYEDVLRKKDGSWKISSRKVVTHN